MKISSLVLMSVLLFPVLPRAEGTTADARQMLAQAKVLQRKDKKSAEPWLLRGKAYEAQGKKKKALSSFAKALKRDPLSAEAYYRRGKIFEDLKKPDEAANEYQAALQADAGHAGAKQAWARLSATLAEAPVK